jgi:hypothetical protein
MDNLLAPWDLGIVAIFESAVPVRDRPGGLYAELGPAHCLNPAHAIAWEQAMFCQGGSVTPSMLPGPHVGDGPLTRDGPTHQALKMEG